MILTAAPQFNPNTTKPLANLKLDRAIIRCIQRALDEDIGTGDITTDHIVPPAANGAAQIIAKQEGLVSGIAVAQSVFLLLSSDVCATTTCSEGDFVTRGQTLIELSGPARVLLTGERTALNFLARMSGVATLTRQFVDAIAGTEARILDTRKTAPGLRAIDKLAVQHGGGANHRFGLDDMVLIKNNHIDQAGSLNEAVRLVRSAKLNLPIEVEARTIAEVEAALRLGIKRILLDNMSLGDLEEAVTLCGGRAKLEASGNVSLANVRKIAETGVNFISVGALTHSAKAFDVSMKWIS
jgi:nicotinate-nucleotide pyrophosphorylase (carboxylating)